MISANPALLGSYDYAEVVRSVLIAIIASYVALDLAGRVRAAKGGVRLAWLSGGAIAMGIGIWTMHFKGMLAFHLPVPVEYHWPTVLASLLVAVLASAVALFVASRQKMGPVAALAGSIFMGAGIAGMHYIGVAAMRMPAVARFSPFLVACSVLLAILFSLIALLMAFGLREEIRWSVLRRLGSATVMGVAVSAMHYTGMAAATFIPASPPDLSYAVGISPVGGFGVTLVTLILFVAAITTSSEDRRRSQDRLQLVIDTAPAMLHSARPDGYVDFFNKRWLEYVGVSLEDISGWRWTQVIHADDFAQLVDRWRMSVTTGNPFEAEARMRRADGEYRLMLLRKVPLRDDTGGIVKWYGSAIDIEDRKRAQEELKSSEERHRVIVEAASDAVISIDESGGIQLANPATARIFGYDVFDLIGKPLTVLMPEFMRKLHEAGFRRYLATGQRHLNWQGAELTALRKNGQEFPVEVSFGETTSSGHKVFSGFIRDISEKKRAEDELRKQKEVFQKIFENIPAMIVLLDQRGRHALVNPEWERTIGWTLEELREQNPDIFAVAFPDPQYRQIVKDGIAASTGEWTDLKVRVRDGRVIDAAATFVHLSDGSTLFIGRDITERKRAEAALREGEARFRLVADSAPVMIWMAGTDKRCTYFNKPWLDFTGRSIDRELGNGWADGVAPEDLHRCLDTYTQAFDRREAFRMEYRLRRNDGEYRWVLDIGVPRFHPDGSFAGYIGSCIDVTDQRRAEESLRRTQADLARVSRVVAMGELAAAIAHEVNQPLGAVVTNAGASQRWLAGQPPNLQEAREAIDRTVRDANRASEVIARIRALLQKGTPQMEQLDVNTIIAEVLTLAGNELLQSGVAVKTDLKPDVPNVLGDRVQLQQVLLNLILNGIDAMRTITHRPRELGIKSARHPDGVLIQVHDSGQGVDPEQANHIFDPFFTSKPQGIGIGLSVGRSIVEAHGGRLWFTPGPAHGAVFQFTVPRTDTSDERAA